MARFDNLFIRLIATSLKSTGDFPQGIAPRTVYRPPSPMGLADRRASLPLTLFSVGWDIQRFPDHQVQTIVFQVL